MSTITLTEENFQSTVDASDILILDFKAAWCGPCKSFAPIFAAAAEKHTDITFGVIDTDEQMGLAQAFGIRSVPTLMVLREKVLVYRESGALPAGAFEQLIQQVRDLDMAQVHAEVAKQNQA